MAGILERIRGKKMAVNEVDEQIRTVQAELEQLRARQTELETAFAETWGGNANPKLEAEFAGNQLRIKTGENVLLRLEDERKAAEQREALENLRIHLQKRAEAANVANAARAKLIRATEKLRAAQVEYREIHRDWSRVDGDCRGAENRCKRLGVSEEAINQARRDLPAQPVNRLPDGVTDR